MAKEQQKKGVSGFSTMIIFMLVAGLLWLIIKLSDTYTVTVPFAIHYVDIPASQLIENNDEEVNVTVSTTGFKLLNYYFKNKKNRKIDISLKEAKYKKHDGNTYSYNSRIIIDNVGEMLSSNTTDITLAEDVQFFSMSRLASKKVKIIPVTNFSFEKQYDYYGEPSAMPDSTTIYGSVNDVNNTKELKTKVITKKNVNQNITAKVKIDLNEGLRADIDEVEVFANVEKFTESEVVIPIGIPESLNIHLYPSKASVRFIVAMKDYPIINTMSFKAIADTTDMFYNDFLPVKLVLSPSNTQIIGIDPKEVEYIIVQQ